MQRMFDFIEIRRKNSNAACKDASNQKAIGLLYSWQQSAVTEGKKRKIYENVSYADRCYHKILELPCQRLLLLYQFLLTVVDKNIFVTVKVLNEVY